MNRRVTRRAFGGLALGAVSAGAVGAQSGNPCERVDGIGFWSMLAGIETFDDQKSYYLEFTHDASGLYFGFYGPREGSPGRHEGDLGGFSQMFNAVPWFVEDLRTNDGRSVYVVIRDLSSDFAWEVRGRAVPETGISDLETMEIDWFGSVMLEIGVEDIRRLYAFMRDTDTNMELEGGLVLADGSRHVAFSRTIQTLGLGALDGEAGAVLDRIDANTTDEACATDEECFLTTACCEAFGRPDDGLELRTLRRFRDGWLADQPDGAEQIAEYYRIAPPICAAIAADPWGRWQLARIYLGTILPCVALIRVGLRGLARRRYTAMTARLSGRYAAQLTNGHEKETAQ